MQGFDPRLVRITIGVNGVMKSYDGSFAITVSGTKYANTLQNECEITLANLDSETVNAIVTQTSPFNFNRVPKTVIVEAGRVSYGYTKIFVGNIVLASVSQPPDIIVTLKCLTANFLKGSILSGFGAGVVSLKAASSQVANFLGVALNFQATDKSISNLSLNGAATKQIDYLNSVGGINVFIDNNTLIVKNANQPISGTLRVLSASTGMIGVPQFTEQGVKVKFFIDNKTTLGGALQIISKINPAVNGTYVIFKLGFQIASRDTPFYYEAEAARIQ